MNGIANAVKRNDFFALRIQSGIFSGLAFRHAVLALAFTAGYNIFGQLGLLGREEMSLVIRMMSFAKLPLHLAIASFAIIAAVAADNTMQSGAARLMRYPAAVLVAALAGSVLIQVFMPPSDESGAHALTALAQIGDVHTFQVARRFLTALYICTLVVALYVVLETNHRAGLALHKARLKTLTEQRDACAAELSAMQARVDPELLFESLRLVDEAYGVDAVLGQSRLDALIRFLRAALPGKTGNTSTVRLEKELVEAYVELVASEVDSSHQSFFRADPDLLDEPVPPMILLPLVRWAMTGASADGLTISVDRCNTPFKILALTVGNRIPNASATHDDEIQIVKKRLECLYGNEVRVRVSAADGQRLAVVEFPTEFA